MVATLIFTAAASSVLTLMVVASILVASMPAVPKNHCRAKFVADKGGEKKYEAVLGGRTFHVTVPDKGNPTIR